MLRQSLLTLALVLAASSAHALVELKASYSMHDIGSTALSDAFPSAPKIDKMESIGVDIMGQVPLMPVGLGLRHEMFKKSSTNGSVGSGIEWKRTSVLVNKRFIDTLMYVGPIATVSITNDFKYSVDNGTVVDYKSGNGTTVTVGVEGGLKLIVLRIGAEVGYLYAPLGELKDSSGSPVMSNGSAVKVDMSGPYYRATIGFGF